MSAWAAIDGGACGMASGRGRSGADPIGEHIVLSLNGADTVRVAGVWRGQDRPVRRRSSGRPSTIRTD